MSVRKPFRAQPVRLGPHLSAQRRRGTQLFAAKVLGAAAVAGLLIGAMSVPTVRAQVGKVPAALGLARARAPQTGDHWQGCNHARAAGTAPIYAGEPGYREGLDGDGDGIACEPVPQGKIVGGGIRSSRVTI